MGRSWGRRALIALWSAVYGDDMRRPRTLLLALTTLAWSAATPVAYADGELTPSARQVRVGDSVTVSTDLCPTGQTVTAVHQQTLHPMAKGLPPFTPLDLTAIGLAQTANGASFHVTADETRTTLNFRLSCSDGTEAETALGVEVHPTYGELWWAYNNYEPVFTATPGFLFFLGAHTMDCRPGSGAKGTLTAPGAFAPALSLEEVVGDDGTIVFDMMIPADLPGGTYSASITCTTTTGATLTDTTPVTVAGVSMPPTGNATTPLLVAVTLLALGLLALGTARSGLRCTRGHHIP